MLILNSLPIRVILIFHSILLLVLLYYLRTQIRVLLEYNSAKWYLDPYLG